MKSTNAQAGGFESALPKISKWSRSFVQVRWRRAYTAKGRHFQGGGQNRYRNENEKIPVICMYNMCLPCHNNDIYRSEMKIIANVLKVIEPVRQIRCFRAQRPWGGLIGIARGRSNSQRPAWFCYLSRNILLACIDLKWNRHLFQMRIREADGAC